MNSFLRCKGQRFIFVKSYVMGKIVLDSKNKNDLNLILHLAERLGVNVKKEEGSVSSKASGKRLAKILQKLADSGGVKSIRDAVKWQRTIRTDRKLPARG